MIKWTQFLKTIADRRILSFFLVISIIIFGIMDVQNVLADDEQTISLDMLIAPPSPGFVLMSIEPAGVERPGTATDLAISVLNNTDNLSSLPRDFAVEFAPYWLMAGNNIQYEEYSNPKNIVSIILHTLSVSLASASNDALRADSLAKELAIGVRGSFLSGQIDPEFHNYAVRLDSLYENLGNINSEFASRFQSRIDSDLVIRALNQQLTTAPSSTIPFIEAQLGEREGQIKREVESEVRDEFEDQFSEAKAIASSLRFRRLGWKLDFAGGVSAGFSNNTFDSGKLAKWGFWLTGGHEWKHHSILEVFRYIGNRADDDLSSIDIGTRAIYDDSRKFSLSFEALYRIFPNSDEMQNQWRASFLLDYAIAKNKAISFTFGRDFGGRQSGNIISLINLVLGFGSDRPIL